MGTVAVVGAGLSGAVVAHKLANAGIKCDVFESRTHVAGNCHTERDRDTGVLMHVYGPHIFHTDNEEVWNFVTQFDEFGSFINRVKALVKGRVYSLPINLLTINQFFGRSFSPNEAKSFLNTLSDVSITAPQTFEEQALRFVGRDLYEAFFKHYTLKQWGLSPAELPASILKRLPVRFDYNDNYYASKFQGIPKNGYTYIIEKLLDHKNINLTTGCKFARSGASDYLHTFNSGCLDEWFDFCAGRLAYRTLDFEIERHDGDFQGNAVMNYCDAEVQWTRITEHKHFSPWESHNRTVIYREFSRTCEEKDIPFYPIPQIVGKNSIETYRRLARDEKNVTFLGRLGTYRYLDMHVTIEEALRTVEKMMPSLSS